VEFAFERGLQHVIIWEVAQDLHPSDPNSLLRAAYEARQSLISMMGDYDGDGEVNADDYELWTKTFGSLSDLRADGNSDDTVNAADYVVWRKFVAAGSGAATAAPVPEPQASCFLLMLGTLVVGTRRRRLRI
jgi:hypothetical protein